MAAAPDLVLVVVVGRCRRRQGDSSQSVVEREGGVSVVEVVHQSGVAQVEQFAHRVQPSEIQI